MVQFASTPRFRKLLVNAVLVPVVLMLVIALLLVWQIDRLENASSLVSHSDQVIAEANELQKLTLDLETGLRGFLLTGVPTFLDPYNNALTQAPTESRKLHKLIEDNPAQTHILEQINTMRMYWLQYAREQIERRKTDGDYSSLTRLQQGKSQMDASRELYKTFIGNEERLRDARSSNARWASHLTLALTGFAALLGGGALAFVSRNQFIALSRTYDAALKVAHDLNTTLENRVQERTLELQRQSLQLAETNSELEAFAYSISHDLRAPMRHISGFVELIRKSGAIFAAETDEMLVTVADTAKLAGRMVDDLLSFSRIGRAPLRIVTVDLNPLLEQCRRELAPDIAGREIEWSISVLPSVQGDPSLLKMVWQNLLANAVKYTSKTARARIEVAVTNESEPQAEQSFSPPQNMVTFVVRDNGIGFDMEYAQKLFGVFQRLHRAEEFEGTGIGLANVRRIILRHGGRVWAKSSLGEGAAFYLSLKAAEGSSL